MTDPQGRDPRRRPGSDPLAALETWPRCERVQADGVPCAELGTACESCAEFLAWRDRLRAQVGPE